MTKPKREVNLNRSSSLARCSFPPRNHKADNDNDNYRSATSDYVRGNWRRLQPLSAGVDSSGDSKQGCRGTGEGWNGGGVGRQNVCPHAACRFPLVWRPTSMISYLQRAICKFEYARRTRHIIRTYTHGHTHTGTRTHRGTTETPTQLEPHNRSRIGSRMLSSVEAMRFHCELRACSLSPSLFLPVPLFFSVFLHVRGEVKTSGNCFCMSALARQGGKARPK